MDYKIEKPIRLNGKSPHDGLYSWFIEEMDQATKQLGPNYIPWSWNFHFEARDLMVVRALEKKDDKPAEVRQHIRGRLFPEMKDRRAAATFSFFGTNRTIESFTLNIVRTTGDREDIHVTGAMAFEYEWDFESLMQSDSVEIEISLTAEKYDTLAEFIADGRSKAVVTLGLVDGFYSQWSPSIRTNDIKILSSLQDQKVKIDAGNDIAPPVLGKAGEFVLRLMMDRDDGQLSDTTSDEDTETVVQRATVQAPTSPIELGQLEKKLSQLAMPLWITVGLLTINLFLR
ncbi:hypothetical protein [Rhizobium laguerreae]|uniref:hypothetical protein n=1 Tax=Rhizobium laguerreae TaxID=1076926 RepID=UPI00103A3714|nr:hypothetical protein [Rhizobium laguerreae]TBY04240.1 hypothetical protein E0I94_26170 [Rhizobium laguerreae]